MFRKNWMLIVALAVWATLCPSGDGSFGQSSTPAAQQPSQPQQVDLGPLNDALQNIESAIKAAKPDGKSADDITHEKEREQKSDIHEDRDLKAQDKAADAAEMNAYFAAAGAFGLLLSLCMTWAALGVAKNTARQQLRAYPVVSGGHIKTVNLREGGIGIEVHILMRNTGATPAYSFQTSPLFVKIDLPENIPFSNPAAHGGASILGPGEAASVHKTIKIEASELDELKAQTKVVYIWGIAVFRDIYRSPRHVYFRIINGQELFDPPNCWSVGPHNMGYETSEG
jgi:hypothetical protein